MIKDLVILFHISGIGATVAQKYTIITNDSNGFDVYVSWCSRRTVFSLLESFLE